MSKRSQKSLNAAIALISRVELYQQFVAWLFSTKELIVSVLRNPLTGFRKGLFDKCRQLAETERDFIKAQLDLNHFSKITILGSGSMPITGIVMASSFPNKNILLVDWSKIALIASRKVINRLGFSTISYLRADAHLLEEDAFEDSVVVISKYVLNKNWLIKNILAFCKNVPLILVRSWPGEREQIEKDLGPYYKASMVQSRTLRKGSPGCHLVAYWQSGIYNSKQTTQHKD